ncbi:hypothetical protein GCM10022221_52700 [Actinocorallia aurea]
MRTRGPLLAVVGAVLLTLGAVYAFVAAARVPPAPLGPGVVITATPDPSATGGPPEAHPVTPAPPRDADELDDDGGDDAGDDHGGDRPEPGDDHGGGDDG